MRQLIPLGTSLTREVKCAQECFRQLYLIFDEPPDQDRIILSFLTSLVSHSSVFDHLHRRNETEQVSPHEPSHHFLNMTDAQLLSCISQIHTTNVQAVAHIPYLRLSNSNPQLLCTAQSKPPNNILQTPTLKFHRQLNSSPFSSPTRNTRILASTTPSATPYHPHRQITVSQTPSPPSVPCSHIKDQPINPDPRPSLTHPTTNTAYARRQL